MRSTRFFRLSTRVQLAVTVLQVTGRVLLGQTDPSSCAVSGVTALFGLQCQDNLLVRDGPHGLSRLGDADDRSALGEGIDDLGDRRPEIDLRIRAPRDG